MHFIVFCIFQVNVQTEYANEALGFIAKICRKYKVVKKHEKIAKEIHEIFVSQILKTFFLLLDEIFFLI